MGNLLSGKSAVVTGGSRGIGRAIVERLARDGANVVFCYQRDEASAQAVVDACADLAGDVHATQIDLATPDAITRLFDAADKHLDGLDVLVSNAAASFLPTRMVDLTDDDYERVMTVNTKAVFQSLQHAARHMRDGGRIVNISTLNTTMRGPGISLYAASKGAVEQLTAVAAHELGSRGITVNTVSPGATDTDLLRATNSQAGLERWVGLTPLGRLGQPADVADVVAFLVGPDARWLTGQNLRATGGVG